MNIGIIDADLIGRKRHRFPNLASMKISAWHKKAGDAVTLLTDYESIQDYYKVYVSKAFTDTKVPLDVIESENVICGGTGFYYDKAPSLPYDVEHCKPDYHLYDDWVRKQIESGKSPKEFTYYTDYSIGFSTRGCFRQCEFCVNRNCKKSEKHSPIFEFLYRSRKKICLLDDNFFACKDWREIALALRETGKRFQFKQGLDERLLTEEKIDEMMSWNYDGDYIFAFDNIDDREIIEEKLKLIRRKYPNVKRKLKFYVLCGYDRSGIYGPDFWPKDIRDTFERVRILNQYGAVPYIMRFEKAYSSEYSGLYSCLASWCNQLNIFKKFSFKMYCICKGMGTRYQIYKRDYKSYLRDGYGKGATWRYMEDFSEKFKDISEKYFDMMGS